MEAMGGTKTNQHFASGTCLLLSEGAYSDYGVIAVMYVLRDFWVRDVLFEYFEEHPEVKTQYFEPEKLIPWLIKRQYVAEMPTETWHIGSYGEVEIPDA